MKGNQFTLLSFNLFIIMVGIGLVIPILPFYVEKFNANAQIMGLLVAMFAFMQFIFAPIWGRYSDKIGRKPLIVLGLFGFAVAEFIFAFATGLWMLFLSRALAGIFGSALMPTAMAYVSDVTAEEKRGQGMGLLGAAMSLGIVIRPGIGGWLAEFDLSYPFIFAGIAATLAGVLSITILPESYPKEARQANKLEHDEEKIRSDHTNEDYVVKSSRIFTYFSFYYEFWISKLSSYFWLLFNGAIFFWSTTSWFNYFINRCDRNNDSRGCCW